MTQQTAQVMEDLRKRNENRRLMALKDTGLPAKIISAIYAAGLNIETKEVSDAVCAYGLVLELTKQVFGEENMTEEVMTTAITAGSYAMWRGIMGPKIPESPTAPKGARRV